MSAGYSAVWTPTSCLDMVAKERIPGPAGRLNQVTYSTGNHSTHSKILAHWDYRLERKIKYIRVAFVFHIEQECYRGHPEIRSNGHLPWTHYYNWMKCDNATHVTHTSSPYALKLSVRVILNKKYLCLNAHRKLVGQNFWTRCVLHSYISETENVMAWTSCYIPRKRGMLEVPG